jgi:alpha-2-macroglobulin
VTPRRAFALVGRAGVLAGLLALDVLADETDARPPRPIAAREAVAPVAPALPAEVVAAMQEGRYDEASAALEKLAAKGKTADETAYFSLIRGIGERLAGRPDAARRVLSDALKAAPKGLWAAKIRFELAAVELAAGRHADAEALARAEAETLLAGDRKDRLAEVYYAFARRLLKPDDPISKPDPNAAYEMLSQARGLAKGEALRARLLFTMGRASQEAGNPARAIQDYQSYLKDYPKGADRPSARFHLGEAQRDAGQALAARLTWADLARDLDRKDISREDSETRARSLYEIAHTYGVPKPPDDTSLNLGVAALRRFLAAYPSHPWAVRASYEIGESYLSRGKSQEALSAFERFLKEEGFRAESDEAKKDLARLAMTATFQVGQVLQGQQKFDEAIAAWKGYLAKFPNGPQSADAQRAILDTQLLIGDDHAGRRQFAEARAAWQAFVAQNPLDARVPQVLFRVGESFVEEKQPDRAIAAWEPLISKFPASEPAAHAQFLIASIFETDKGEPAAAIERFKQVAVEPWKSQALQRVAVMEAKALTVVTPRAFRKGETAHLKVTTRNLEKLTFTAYRLNAESYFRKKHALRGVEALDIGLVRPDAEWTVAVPGYAKYRPVETSYDLKVEVPGVFVVKVTDETTLQATTLVLGSDLDAIVKASRDQVLVFAQDMKTGRGRAGARVLIADGDEVILESKTGDDGVLLKAWDKPREGGALRYLVLDGGDVAGSGLGVPQAVSQGLSPRAYIYADRPAYRPGQKVALRGVVREVADGQYANVPGASYRLEVTDSRGRQIVARPVTLSAFGTFHETLPLDEAAPVGTYRVRVYKPGGSDFAGQFEVQAYRLEKVDLAFDLKKTVYFRGETIEADLVARYQYGAPAANRPVAVRLPDGRILRGATDASGKYHVTFPTEGFAEEQALRLIAQMPQDNVATASTVMLAVRAFAIDLKTSRDVYLDGETFQVRVTTTDAQGEPTGETLAVSVLKLVTQAGRVTEREVKREEIKTDPKTGRGVASVRVEDKPGGRYVVRASGTDRFGNPVVADRALMISGQEDEDRLRLLADRQVYKVGEEASVNLHSRGRAGTALLAWEADRILQYRLVALKDGDNPVSWPVVGAQFPNFTLTASRMSGTHFDQAKLDVRVERDLRVTVTPTKPAVGPGEEVEVEVTTADQLGRPVPAEIALALVDRSLLRLYADTLPPIGSFFYDQTRTGAFATEATNTFRYEPATSAVSEAVVEEAERAAAIAANQAGRGAIIDAAQGYAFMGRAANGPIAGGMGGMGDPGGLPAPAAQPTTPAELNAYASGSTIPLQQGPHQSSLAVGGPGAAGKPAMADAAGVERLRRESEALNDNLAYSDLGELRDKDAAAGEKQLGERLGEDRRALAEGTRFWGVDGAAKKEAGLAAQPRQRFVETAYWNPAVVTDAQGKARVTFRAPMALSEYRFSARGVTGADTLVGQTTAELAVRKDFFVDLKVPAALTQGDRPRFVAQVHHAGVTGRVELKLTAYAGGRETVEPRTIDVKADGVDEVLFEPFEVPDGDTVRLTLTGAVGDDKDEVVVEVPIRPWGVQAFASASGTASDDATVFVGLPAGRSYESPEMLVVISPSLRRLLVELALDRDAYPLNVYASRCIFPPPPATTADRAGDLLAASSALGYLRAVRATAAPEAERLTSRIRGLVSELIAAQNEDGGWSWVVGVQAGPNQNARRSDRATSARVVWALASAEPLGLLTDPAVVEKASAFLAQEFARAGGSDLDTRAVMLHALSTRKKATFEQANSLNRLRQGLSDAALAYLALTLANLDRAPMAGEVLDVLAGRARTEPVGPGLRPRKYWEGRSNLPFNRGPVEATALAALAFAQARPADAVLDQAADWLLAHRDGTGWRPAKARGPALAALSSYYGRAQGAEDRYELVVTVNETEVARLNVLGATEGRALLVPRLALKAGDRNRVRFDITGRGTFGYAVTLTGFTRDFGPDQARDNRTALIDRRVYHPAPPELDGKVLPTGFRAAVDATPFQNRATRLALGGKARVEVVATRNEPGNRPEWERDFLVVEEHLPAGTTLIEGSVQTSASSYTLADGVLSLYFAPDQWPGRVEYEVYGYLPGQYRALPASIRSAYEPGRMHLGPAGELRVLTPDEPNTDPYRATPDELFARGKAHFDAGRLAEAAVPLEELFGGYTLRDDVAKEAARMLLLINIQEYRPRKVVQYFEVVKEKAPELVISFDDLLVIGRAYRDINEHERAYLVWRGVVEASYLEDGRVGEVLRQRGRTLEGIAYLLGLWREYPNTASIESDFFGLSQVLAQHAGRAVTDPSLRRELADAGVTRSELLLQAIRLIQVALALSPKDPLADEESLALVGAFLELEDYDAVVRLSSRFAKLYPRSTFLDSFQYSEALGDFHLGRYDRAVEVAEAIAKAVYKDANGVDQPSPNKWQALYILGQIYDARRDPARALTYYEQVAERFSDASGAVRSYTRKDLKLPEVTVVRPGAKADAKVPQRETPGVTLDYRNVAEADVKVYPVDLMRLYLTRRNLDEVAGIDLAGITPLFETTVKLGDGKDFEDRRKAIDLPLPKEGAYLVMARGDNLYASGIVLVTPLEMEVLEEPEAGRVRVTVRDAKTRDFAPKVQVKVIGGENPNFLSGETDLRGIFVAEGVQGEVAAVARKGDGQYAFYRGTARVGAPPAPNAMPGAANRDAGPDRQAPNSETLEQNLMIQNYSNQVRQIERLQNRYNQGGQGGAAAKGFK